MTKEQPKCSPRSKFDDDTVHVLMRRITVHWFPYGRVTVIPEALLVSAPMMAASRQYLEISSHIRDVFSPVDNIRNCVRGRPLTISDRSANVWWVNVYLQGQIHPG